MDKILVIFDIKYFLLINRVFINMIIDLYIKMFKWVYRINIVYSKFLIIMWYYFKK